MLLITILLLSMIFALSSADPLFTFCSTEYKNYTPGGQFEANLNLLLDALSSNTTLNTSLPGFYNTSIGDSPDKVYGQALCRGDIDFTVCQSCVQNASHYIFENCESIDAIIWYELCQVQYSFQMFFSKVQVYTGKYPEHINREKNVSGRSRLGQVMLFLMNNISYEAAVNPFKFATGQVRFSSKEIVYGLVQCTTNIAQDDCSSCLKSALQELKTCCSYRQGGIILSRSCNVRFEMYLFYNDTSSSLVVYPFPKGDKWKTWKVVGVTCTSALLLVIFICSCAVFLRRKKGTETDDKSEHALLQELASHKAVTVTEEGNLVTSEELPFVDLTTIRAATDDFADSNKLGQGGFGTVYKGVLPDGKEVAVKRLSRKSWQGTEAFKNEAILIAKLQHRNLVKLVGCGMEGEEKLLLYEFMPNRSLDFFIFDLERRSQLDWETYYNIISGIARGLLYLHEDSRHKIIHRDLKPSNVLLDHEMVAKISDFGMARIFCENQNTANTKRVVGTYGYMAPEYAMGGVFSVKSDVFSLGVILLEIISGKKNSGFYLTEHAQTLLSYEDPEDRPRMSDVVVLLKGSESISLPEPSEPAAFAVGRAAVPNGQLTTTDHTVNGLTVSVILPR
ncbi:hypothetical protein TIFTF001_018964 [Ficus carica]|uniref:non-specific serine/threonine protein kinase n=1 Tax=Ficus carica TaxID=3494 RepID=A0AA88DC72_FICCA|nr:hypothetical protein TIFTF001_018964 [Ficus carica]